jgi:hypothetical protein
MDFYTQFVRAHPNCIIGFRAFQKLKPYYVRRLKDHNTCACKYDIEMVELCVTFNNMHTSVKGIHGSVCVIVLFVAMIVQAIMLLKECNFMVSLICGCH